MQSHAMLCDTKRIFTNSIDWHSKKNVREIFFVVFIPRILWIWMCGILHTSIGKFTFLQLRKNPIPISFYPWLTSWQFRTNSILGHAAKTDLQWKFIWCAFYGVFFLSFFCSFFIIYYYFSLLLFLFISRSPETIINMCILRYICTIAFNDDDDDVYTTIRCLSIK